MKLELINNIFLKINRIVGWLKGKKEMKNKFEI